MSDATRQKATLFVGGLDDQVTSQTLHDAFLPFGEIVDVSLPKPDLASATSPHRGFAYIEFSLAEDATEAISNMDQAELFGRVLKVNQARPQQKAGEGLGSRTAVWEQEGYASRFNVNDEDGMEAEANGGGGGGAQRGVNPMQGLEGLDEAGPKLK